MTARWTWPIEAAANASSSNDSKWSPTVPPSSSSSSLRTFLNGSGGTSSRSAASVALNSSRSDSGIAVKSIGGEDLADLHRRAAELAELLDELARERGGALAGGGVGVLGGAQAVGRARARPAGGLAGDEAAEARGAADAIGGRGVRPSLQGTEPGPSGYH